MLAAIFSRRFVSGALVFLFLTAAFLYAFPSPTVSYAVIVLLHALAGAVAAVALAVFLARNARHLRGLQTVGWLLMLLGSVFGVALIYLGTARPQWTWMYMHILFSLVAGALLLAQWLSDRSRAANAWRKLAMLAACATLLAGAAWTANTTRHAGWQAAHRIDNPALPPDSMDGEGDGPGGKFFPSSAQTLDGKNIPSNYFMESDSCQRCHADIYKQWYSSAHHFSSFNNQWYRKSIEYMQDVVGTRPSKWCGGCHDPAVLYSGLMDTPIQQIVHRPEAQAGLGCMMCHSIARVKSTMGQGDFVLEYPKLHELAASKNPLVRLFHDYVIRLNPEPHRRTFLKPFMREQTAEFCSSCHKVHLDVPVNSYRWIRGFNEYDNWQASGVSGQGARSFYYPEKSQQCADCHMPAVASRDDGNLAGAVHSHAFPAANTALPYANGDDAQFKLTADFLKDTVTVDIFALTPARKLAEGSVAQSDTATTFAVGEEAESTTTAAHVEAAPLTAPLNRVNATVRRSDDVSVEVVVRTRKVGHFFPGGTVDAYDTWVELKGTDETGRVLFWSGKVEDDGLGPVEKGAHFYRSLLVDAHGNAINKRNAWAARSVVYVRLIPPGAADTVHYRLHVPSDAGNRIKLHARLCYRKFSWFNTHFSYAGESNGAQKAAYSAHFDDRALTFTASLAEVSGQLKKIPDLPVVPVSENEVELRVLPASASTPKPTIALQKQDWTRWNDYGIGLFLQGDLKGARAAFEKITQVDPANPDGWVNIGRVAVQEGDMESARDALQHALQLAPNLARAHFFYAKVLRNDGKYAEAVTHLEQVLARYPRDRVARNDVGRLLFLQRRYGDAVAQLQQVLAVDPEDLQAHYNLMLCYGGLGEAAMAEHERKLYLRFKADESAQAITGEYRRTHPEDNNERQAIHEHVSVALAAPQRAVPAKMRSDIRSVIPARRNAAAAAARGQSPGGN